MTNNFNETKNIRQQLTLFLDKKDAKEIEAIREKFNFQQAKLINCHVTLCREDEIVNIHKIIDNIAIFDPGVITIDFGKVMRFYNGNGVLIPGLKDDSFHELREKVLKGTHTAIRRHQPHITLMHPRNSTCTDEIFETIKKVNLPTRVMFKSISLIEQVDGGPWQTVKIFNLKTS